jgi:hypothetical protein
MHSVYRALATCLFLSLAACGGGSDSSDPPVAVPPPAPPPPPPPPIDTTAPTVVSRNPDDATTVLPGLGAVTIVFSEPVRLGGALEIRSGSSTGPLVPTTPTVTGAQITLTATAPFPNGDYHVSVANVPDESGNQLATASNWSFRVRPAPDLIAPSLISRTPEPGSITSPDVVIRLTFDEALSLPPGLFELRSGSLTGPVVTATVSGSVDNRLWRLNPEGPLPAGTQFFVLVGRAFDDSGNTRPDENWSFSTPSPGFSLATSDLRNLDAQNLPIDARELSLTVDGQRRPLLLFKQTSAPSLSADAQVLRFSNSDTPELERLPLLNADAEIVEQTVRVDADDAPLVAWIQHEITNACVGNTFAPQLHVARFAAGAWTRLGGTVHGDFCLRPADVAMALGGNGEIFVASSEQAGPGAPPRAPRVRRFDNGNWVDAGTGLALRTAGTSGVLTMALTVAPDTGRPVTAWTENNGGTLRTYVSRLNAAGDTWVDVGGIARTHAGSGFFMSLGLAVSSDGVPYVLVRQNDGLILSRFVNDAWVQVGPLLQVAPGMQPSEFSLALVNDAPVIAFANGADLISSVARLDTAANDWVISTVQANTEDLTELVHDPQNGIYWIAFRTDGFRSAPRLSRALVIP